jgi:hypothetical protein
LFIFLLQLSAGQNLYPAAVSGYAFSAAACIIFSNKSLISVGSGARLTEF